VRSNLLCRAWEKGEGREEGRKFKIRRSLICGSSQDLHVEPTPFLVHLIPEIKIVPSSMTVDDFITLTT
jgi:hypothetical protein